MTRVRGALTTWGPGMLYRTTLNFRIQMRVAGHKLRENERKTIVIHVYDLDRQTICRKCCMDAVTKLKQEKISIKPYEHNPDEKSTTKSSLIT